MTSITSKFISTIKTTYETFNPSILDGAIDVIVVQQEDGSLRCTPFHVRFGNLGVLQSLQNKVHITINDIHVKDLYMQLGEAGEAVFLEENVSTPNIPPIRHLEPSDSGTFLDPDNAISLFSEGNSHSHLSNIDCSTQIVNAQLDKEQSNRRRPKYRSRTRKRVSTPMVGKKQRSSIANTNEKFRTSIELLLKRSVSENDLRSCHFDLEIPPCVDADNQPITLNLNGTTNNDEHLSMENIDQKTARALSNPFAIEQMYEPKKSVPLENMNGNNLRRSQSSDPPADCYSPTTSHESPSSSRPTSPNSDTEYQSEKPPAESTSGFWRWKWGKLPEQRKSVFDYIWPLSNKNTPKEDVYLDDITSNRVVDPSRYLPQLDYHQQRTTNDDDQESGTGNSIPQSPFREHESSCLFADAQLSLCGNINKESSITDDLFNAHLISFEIFAGNPSIVHDPNLVVRIDGKYYNWNVASALIIAASIFHKQLPMETIEQLKEKHMAQTKPQTTGIGWWSSLYSKNLNTKNETAKVTTTSLTMKSDSSETKKASKIDNDSEQEDSEVRKLTANMEEKAHRQQSNSTHSTIKPILKKTMILSSEQLKRLNLKLGMNKVKFSVTTSLQGTAIVKSNIYLFDHMTKFVISDIDGTITKSDFLGQVFPLVGGDWSHDGIAEFFNAIQENGYQFIYLSARAIGQSQITRNLLKNVKQSNQELPKGPLLISPDTLMTALYREVIAKKPEGFKIECLKNIASLYPGKNPFYAGFGNRINDQWAYTAVQIPVTRIYTINPRSEVFRPKLSQALSTSYKNLHQIVDLLFPPMNSFSARETYSAYTYTRGIPATIALPRTTPTTTVLSPGGEPLLTIAEATENTVK